VGVAPDQNYYLTNGHRAPQVGNLVFGGEQPVRVKVWPFYPSPMGDTVSLGMVARTVALAVAADPTDANRIAACNYVAVEARPRDCHFQAAGSVAVDAVAADSHSLVAAVQRPVVGLVAPAIVTQVSAQQLPDVAGLSYRRQVALMCGHHNLS